MPEPVDFSKVLVKADGHRTRVLVDLQTQGGDLIVYKFVHLYRIATRLSDKKILSTGIKGSQARIDTECAILLDRIEYLEECTLCIAQLSEWDTIFAEPALSALNRQLSGSREPVTKQQPNMQRFPLTVWRRWRTKVSFCSARVKITCVEVMGHTDEEEDTLVIVSSKLEEQVKPV